MDVKFNNTVLNNNFTYGRVSAEGTVGNDVLVLYFTNGFVFFTGIVNINTNGNAGMDVYVTYETFAKKRNPDTYYDETYCGWYIMTL